MKRTKADHWFSMYIRLRDCDENRFGQCCTCGKMDDVKYMDCGHYVGRNHMMTRFDEMNAHVQCKGCNGFEEGRKVVYRQHLVKVYGEEAVSKLEIRGKLLKKFGSYEIDQIAKYWKSSAEALAKEKQIKIW